MHYLLCSNRNDMAEHVFKSGYSIEKIENDFRNADFFSGIEEGLREAIAYERNSANARTFSRKGAFQK